MIGYWMLVSTALFWGATDPLLKRFGGQNTVCKENQNAIFAIFVNWRYILAYLVNQLGSLLFVYTLAADIAPLM